MTRRQYSRNYKAIVTDKELGNKRTIVTVYANTKENAIRIMRNNGYSVDPRKVKEEHLFNYIMEQGGADIIDWSLRKIPN